MHLRAMIVMAATVSACGFDALGTGSSGGAGNTFAGDDGADPPPGDDEPDTPGFSGDGTTATDDSGDDDDDDDDVTDGGTAPPGDPPDDPAGTSTGEAEPPGDSSSDGGDGSTGEDAPVPEPYQPCPGGDGDCGPGETCLSTSNDAGSFSVCWAPCDFSADCPAGPGMGGEAWPVCSLAHHNCVLDCTLSWACPDIMSCVPFTIEGIVIGRCMWSD